MMRIKRIRIFSAAKAFGFLYAIIGLIFGEIAALLSSQFQLNVPHLSDEIMGIPLHSALGLVSLIVLPLIYGVIGLLSGALLAIIYNLTAGWFGGIEIEYE
ncbi:MAG: hypothetical protein R3E79_61580 [Caldilineaceae bacterium]